MAKFKIKTGDLVQVISGSKDNKGKQGKVLRVFPETSRVLVEGINVVTRHRKASMQGEAGGIEKVEAPIHVSNVALVDPERDGRQKTVRVRVSKSTGKDL
jgi:large subunit ribosomal protein L24